MHLELINRLGGICLTGKSVVIFTDRPDMTLAKYRHGRETIQQLLLFITSQAPQAPILFVQALKALHRLRKMEARRGGGGARPPPNNLRGGGGQHTLSSPPSIIQPHFPSISL